MKTLLMFLVALALLVPTVSAQNSNVTINLINEETLSNITTSYMQFSYSGGMDYFGKNKTYMDNSSYFDNASYAFDYDFSTYGLTGFTNPSGNVTVSHYVNGSMMVGDSEQMCVRYRYTKSGNMESMNNTITLMRGTTPVAQNYYYQYDDAGTQDETDTICGDPNSGSGLSEDVSVLVWSNTSFPVGLSINWYIYEVYLKEVDYIGNYFFINNSILTNGTNMIYVDDANQNYWTRTYVLNISDTNQSLDAYLISRTSNYVYSTITVVSTSGQGVSGAEVSIQKLVGGSYVPVSQFVTDDAGSGSAYLLLGMPYRLAVTYGGVTYYASITAQSGYNFPLNETIEVNFTSMFDGITFNVTPSYIYYNTSLTTYDVDFEFEIYSNKTMLDLYGMNLYCNGSSVHEQNVSSSFGGQLTHTYDVVGCDNITLNYYFQKNGFGLYWNSIDYGPSQQYPYGLAEAIQRLADEYETSTLNFFVIIILIVVAGALMIISPEVAALTSILVMGAMTYFELLSANLFILISISIFSIMLIKRRWL